MHEIKTLGWERDAEVKQMLQQAALQVGRSLVRQLPILSLSGYKNQSCRVVSFITLMLMGNLTAAFVCIMYAYVHIKDRNGMYEGCTSSMQHPRRSRPP